MPNDTTQHMQCMEVWGGNQVVDSGVVMAGLDAWVYCRPYGASEQGGDVYYVSSCATGRITRLLVADVSGHGAAVCNVAGQLRSLMRRHVNHIDQQRFVEQMNQQFVAMSQSGCFATSVVTTFFATNNHLSLCNAGHPPPLLYRAATARWSFLETDPGESAESNLPLGIVNLASYEQFEVRLRVGDLVLCYTDSLIESRGRDGEMLGQAGLLRIVGSIDANDPTTFVSRLLEGVATEAAGNLDGDDVTVLLFRPNGLAPRLSIRERLAAPVRVMRGVMEAIKSGGRLPLPDLKLANIGGAMVPALGQLWGRRKPVTPGVTVIDR